MIKKETSVNIISQMSCKSILCHDLGRLDWRGVTGRICRKPNAQEDLKFA